MEINKLGARRAIARANGVPIVDQPLLPGGLYMVLSGQGEQPGKTIVVQTYVPRTKPSA